MSGIDEPSDVETKKRLRVTDAEKLVHRGFIGWREIILVELVRGDPTIRMDRATLEFTAGAAFVKRELDAIMLVVPDGFGNPLADFRFDAQSLEEFAPKCLAVGFSRLDFTAGKFPEERKYRIGATLSDEVSTISLDDSGDDANGSLRLDHAFLYGGPSRSCGPIGPALPISMGSAKKAI
jgi:hypothetical protein